MNTVFVTGGEGFTAKHLIELLQSKGHDVVAGVRNRARKLSVERKHGKALVCDVSDPISVARAVASVKPDAVVHLAGCSQPAQASIEPLVAYQSIIAACANVLDAVRRYRPRIRVVLASSCDVYGAAGNCGQPLNEQAATEPMTPFASLKLNAEALAQTFFRNFHVNVTIARPFHYTGAGQSDAMFFAAVAHRMARWDAALHEPLAIPDLGCRRELLHVADVVDAYWRLIENGKPNECYNIAAGQAYTVREIVERIRTTLGCQATIEELPTDSQGRVECLCGDAGKLRSELGWNPTHTLDQAVGDLCGSVARTPTHAGV